MIDIMEDIIVKQEFGDIMEEEKSEFEKVDLSTFRTPEENQAMSQQMEILKPSKREIDEDFATLNLSDYEQTVQD